MAHRQPVKGRRVVRFRAAEPCKGLVRVLLHAAGAVKIMQSHLHRCGAVTILGRLAAVLQPLLLLPPVLIRQPQHLRGKEHHICLFRLPVLLHPFIAHIDTPPSEEFVIIGNYTTRSAATQIPAERKTPGGDPAFYRVLTECRGGKSRPGGCDSTGLKLFLSPAMGPLAGFYDLHHGDHQHR